MDQEIVKQVWQRVQNTPTPPNHTPQQFAQWEQGEYRRCMWLMKHLPGEDRPMLQKIARESREHSRMLMGICRMIGGDSPNPSGDAPLRGTPTQQLQQCYGQKMRLAAEYEKCAEDRSFGHIYRRMAETEKNHAGYLLSMLGKRRNAFS